MQRGDVVGGRYRLTEPLASGGMGTVWRARHVELDVDVAVKVMSPALLRAPTALARFQREARAAAQLRSPHDVQVFDYGVHEEQPYLAMELLAGEDLRTYLERTGPLPLGRAALILDALAKALRVAHAAGIVHRDLKPANVFLERSGDDEIVKILDFGIAKEVGTPVDGLRTSTSTVVGSPLYMSPEQVRGAEVDHRTDLWSLATLTYEMVTGRQPFEGASLGDVFARIVADAIPAPSTVVAGLPTAVDAFFERALARSPDARFASATELAAAFRGSLGDHALAMTRVHAPASAVRPDAPTVGVAPVTGPDLDLPHDDLAEAPTERPDPSWPTSAGARSAPRIAPQEALGPVHRGDEIDTGPLAQRTPASPRRWPTVVAGVVLLSLGVVAVLAGRAASPSPPRPDAATVERAPHAAEPHVVPAVAIETTTTAASPPASAPPDVAGEMAPSSSSSSSPAASSSPSPSGPPAAVPSSRARAPRAAGSSTPSGQSPAPPSTPAIDPIFGVPVGPP